MASRLRLVLGSATALLLLAACEAPPPERPLRVGLRGLSGLGGAETGNRARSLPAPGPGTVIESDSDAESGLGGFVGIDLEASYALNEWVEVGPRLGWRSGSFDLFDDLTVDDPFEVDLLSLGVAGRAYVGGRSATCPIYFEARAGGHYAWLDGVSQAASPDGDFGLHYGLGMGLAPSLGETWSLDLGVFFEDYALGANDDGVSGLGFVLGFSGKF